MLQNDPLQPVAVKTSERPFSSRPVISRDDARPKFNQSLRSNERALHTNTVEKVGQDSLVFL
jgi:hypothetical protein